MDKFGVHADARFGQIVEYQPAPFQGNPPGKPFSNAYMANGVRVAESACGNGGEFVHRVDQAHGDSGVHGELIQQVPQHQVECEPNVHTGVDGCVNVVQSRQAAQTGLRFLMEGGAVECKGGELGKGAEMRQNGGVERACTSEPDGTQYTVGEAQRQPDHGVAPIHAFHRFENGALCNIVGDKRLPRGDDVCIRAEMFR